MDIEIIVIGEELLSGAVVDTNSSHIAQTFLERGYIIERITTVGDRRQDILESFKSASEHVDAVIVTGGLGPTSDDITTAVAASAAKKELVVHDDIVKDLEERFKALGFELTPNNLKQAAFPEGADILENPIGSAPGFMVEIGGKPFFFAPGVPKELELMLANEIIPRLEKISGKALYIRHKTLKTFGLTESRLDHIVTKRVPEGVEIQFRATYPEIHIKLVAKGEDAGKATEALEKAEEKVASEIEDYIFARGDETLEMVVGRLLKEKGLKVALAESCTGGFVSKRLTDIPGSSAYFDRGFITYSNNAKMEQLGVKKETLDEHGAVSAEVAAEMAQGALEKSGADIAVSLTGVAGPSGGTAEKPVGLVYLALAHKDGIIEKDFFRKFGDRNQIRLVSTQVALDMIRRFLQGLEI